MNAARLAQIRTHLIQANHACEFFSPEVVSMLESLSYEDWNDPGNHCFEVAQELPVVITCRTASRNTHIGTTRDRFRQDRHVDGIAETGRLGADPGIFKYTVEVTPVAPNPTPPALDPIIIIER